MRYLQIIQVMKPFYKGNLVCFWGCPLLRHSANKIKQHVEINFWWAKGPCTHPKVPYPGHLWLRIWRSAGSRLTSHSPRFQKTRCCFANHPWEKSWPSNAVWTPKSLVDMLTSGFLCVQWLFQVQIKFTYIIRQHGGRFWRNPPSNCSLCGKQNHWI